MSDCTRQEYKYTNVHCTTDQEPTGLLQLCAADFSFSLTTWQHSNFLVIVKGLHGRHFKIVTSYQKSDSVGRCVFTWGTVLQISSQSHLKQRSLGLFLKRSPPTWRRRRTTTTTRWV